MALAWALNEDIGWETLRDSAMAANLSDADTLALLNKSEYTLRYGIVDTQGYVFTLTPKGDAPTLLFITLKWGEPDTGWILRFPAGQVIEDWDAIIEAQLQLAGVDV